MFANEFPIGTLFTRRSIEPPIGTHFGVHLGGGRVLDLQKDAKTCAYVRFVAFDVFAQGLAVVGTPPPDAFDESVFWARVNEAAQANCISYGVLSRGNDWNCESLVRWLVSGVKVSEQGNRGAALLFAGAAVLGIAAVVGIGVAIASSQKRDDREAA